METYYNILREREIGYTKGIKENITYNLETNTINSFDDQPAIINNDTLTWYNNGLIHRDNFLPAIITLVRFPRVERFIHTVYYEYGILYRRDDLPNDEHFYNDARIKIQSWFTGVKLRDQFYKKVINGLQYYEQNIINVLHKENDEPAQIIYNNQGNISSRIYYNFGYKNRNFDQPAEIGLFNNGNVKYVIWYTNGKKNRLDDKPSEIYYFNNGNIRSEKWHRDNKLHREDDKPAIIRYWKTGGKRVEAWFNNDRRYRDGGLPEIIKYN